MFFVECLFFVATAQVNSWLVGHFSLMQVLRTALDGVMLSMLPLWVQFAAGIDSLPIMACVLFMGYGSLNHAERRGVELAALRTHRRSRVRVISAPCKC